MTINLISASTQLPILLSEVRDFLKISHQDEDALLASYIRAATGVCENFTGRQLIKQQWQLSLNDWREEVVSLPFSPVLSIDRIEVWDGAIFQTINPENYLLDKTSYQARVLPSPAFQWPDPQIEVGGIKIIVSAGFGDDQNAVPHDIRLGIIHWVAAAYDGHGTSENQAILMAEKLWQPYRRMAL